jgi:hypothetical protein
LIDHEVRQPVSPPRRTAGSAHDRDDAAPWSSGAFNGQVPDASRLNPPRADAKSVVADRTTQVGCYRFDHSGTRSGFSFDPRQPSALAALQRHGRSRLPSRKSAPFISQRMRSTRGWLISGHAR